MLEGLQKEIDKHPELTGASKEIVISDLNTDGTAEAETWDIIPLDSQKISISKLKLLTYLTAEQRQGLRNMLAGTSEVEQDLAMLYNSDDTFWINDPFFRGMLRNIATDLSMDEAIVTEIKRLGERKISRSEELFGKKITPEDFE